MPVNANILARFAQPVRSVGDFMADYEAQDARKQGLQRNALLLQESQAAMADRERSRAEAEVIRNALIGLGAGATDDQRIQALKGTGLQGGFAQADTLQKSALERRNIESQAAERESKTKGQNYDLTRKQYEHGKQGLQVAQTPQQAAQMFFDGVQKQYWGMSDAQAQVAGIPQDPVQFQQWKQAQLAELVNAEKLLPVIQTRNTGGSTDTLAMNPLTGVPTTTGSVRNTQSPDSVASNARMAADAAAGRAQSERHFNVRQAAAGGAMDGEDPTQAALNKKFGKPEVGRRWKSDGSLEAIPGGSADAKATSSDMGKGSVNDVVTSLRDMYNQLDDARAITNPEKGAIGNLVAGVASSGPGQATGRMFGTQSQSLRNTVAQQRPLLLQAIMKATGMSAKQMDSNAELKLYLATATDPTLDVVANRRALDMIENLYGKAGSQKPAAPVAPAAAGGFGDAEKEARYQAWKAKQK